jgi:hypothetical protein
MGQINRNTEVFGDLEEELGIMGTSMDDEEDEELCEFIDGEAAESGGEEEEDEAAKNKRLIDQAWEIACATHPTKSDLEKKKKEEREKKKAKKPKTFKTIVYAHAGSRYDNVFMFREILRKQRICPKLIRNGNRLYQMTVKGEGLTHTVFRDSYVLLFQ